MNEERTYRIVSEEEAQRRLEELRLTWRHRRRQDCCTPDEFLSHARAYAL